MDDRQFADLVNRLTKIAKKYANTQQLREQIANELRTSLNHQSPRPKESESS